MRCIVCISCVGLVFEHVRCSPPLEAWPWQMPPLGNLACKQLISSVHVLMYIYGAYHVAQMQCVLSRIDLRLVGAWAVLSCLMHNFRRSLMDD